MDNRSAQITIGGKEYELLLTTKATKEIGKKYGGLSDLGDKLLKAENFETAIDELIWLISLLANQPILVHNAKNPQDKKDWTSAACKNCPVPGILQNNGCQNMALTTYFQKTLLGKRIRAKAWCSRSHGIVRNPNLGCSLCHLPEET